MFLATKSQVAYLRRDSSEFEEREVPCDTVRYGRLSGLVIVSSLLGISTWFFELKCRITVPQETESSSTFQQASFFPGPQLPNSS